MIKPPLADAQMYCVLLVALTITMLLPLVVCPGKYRAISKGRVAILPFKRHDSIPDALHISSTGPSLGRNITIGGPWITAKST